MTDNLAIEPDLFYDKTNLDVSDSTEATDEIAEDEENVSDDTKPTENTESEDNSDSVTDDSDDQEDDSETDEDVEESDIFEVDGLEFTTEQLKEYKQAYDDRKSMQADYTRKNQERSRLVKEEAKKLHEKDSEQLQSLVAELQADIELDETDLNELKEYDEGEYYKQLHKKEKREKLIEKAKKELSNSADTPFLQVEQEKLISANPQWVADGKATDDYIADMKLMDEFLKDHEWSEEDVKSIKTAKTYQLVIDAAKTEKNAKTKKSEKEKAAKMLKPKSIKSSKKTKKVVKDQSLEDIFYS